MIISKKEAIILNQTWYFTGIVCKNGHIDKRYINTGICYSCKRALNKGCNSRNKNTLKTISSRTYIKNRKKNIQRSQEWAIKNREKSRNIKRKYQINNKENLKEKARKYQKNKRKDNFKRLSMNLSKSIWNCLKNDKNKQSWNKLVSFSLEELINHLENKFTQTMNWDNYGKEWHLDHIKPLSWFDLSVDFNVAWDITNLQPLLKFDNLSKGNRFEG